MYQIVMCAPKSLTNSYKNLGWAGQAGEVTRFLSTITSSAPIY